MQLIRRLSLMLTGLLPLTACSAPAATPGREQQAQRQREFGEDDKRIARALSIGGGEVRAGKSPRFYATLCGLALASIAERMQDSGILTAEQSRAFAQAEALYARRAADGATRAERDAIQLEIDTLYPEPGDKARFAIGCLRELAEE
jgi:hypothetical protein